MNINYVVVGLTIKCAREQKKLTQAELAELVGLSLSHIALIEVAKRHISLGSLVRISKILEVSVDMLLTGNMSTELSLHQAWELLLSDCTEIEYRIIYNIARYIKQIIRRHLPSL